MLFFMGKRIFDVFFAFIGMCLFGWLLLIVYLLVTIVTGKNGIFAQERIGQYGKKFTIYKFRTVAWNDNGEATISDFGYFLRKSKIDEWPQLFNVLLNDMSFVGPRPNVAGYYDLLEGDFRKILELKPGITGPASLVYKDEDTLLALQENPLQYNDEIIFPDKLRINLDYYNHHSIGVDVKILFCTIFGK
jgi:lipopolysaccharide/colanic/teichoic acid biosynthesis glycosyltransferase